MGRPETTRYTKRNRSVTYKFASGVSALDVPSDRAVVTHDERRMSAKVLLACSTVRDRQGDVLEVSGIELPNHRLNPLAMSEHGELGYPHPIGKCEDDAGNYCVEIDAARGEAWQETFFDQHNLYPAQLFSLIVQGMLRGNSIGYRPIREVPIPPDYEQGLGKGKHIQRCELVEATWCAMPANQLCAQTELIQKTLSRDRVCGKRLHPVLKRTLTAYAPARKSLVRSGYSCAGSSLLRTQAEPSEIDRVALAIAEEVIDSAARDLSRTSRRLAKLEL